MALPRTIIGAARKDLETLNDPVGLQRAAIQLIADNGCSLEHARYAAGQCRDATETREAIQQYDYLRESAD